ncbi:MAG: lytic transglycosylase domain-containing protein [Bacillota bacterium]
MIAKSGRGWHLTRTLFIFILILILFTSQWFWKLFYPLPYKDSIILHSQENGLDPLMVAAVIRVESGFNPKAVSGPGARGLMQLMPETAQWVSGKLKVNYSSDMLYDPDYNIRLGTWYLANLHTEFNNRVIAIAAYNGGRGRVRTWLNGGIWNGEAKEANNIPIKETRDFVQKVLRDYRIYRWLYTDLKS